MNTNHSDKNKDSTLSATTKASKNNNNSNLSLSLDSNRKNSKDSSFNKLSGCAGGVCTVNWKPNHNVA